MKTSQPRIVSPDIADEVAAMFQRGAEPEAVVTRMRALGLNKIESIKLLRDCGGFAIADGKDIVDLSSAWADCFESDEALNDAAEKAFELAFAEDKLTAA
jgi:ribosomal protein L7/L12